MSRVRSFQCPQCGTWHIGGHGWLGHMVTRHEGATTRQMRYAGISGNPSQRKTDAEAKLGIKINSEKLYDETGPYARYTLVDEAPVAEPAPVPASEPVLVQEGLFTSDTRSPYRQEAA